MFWQRYFEIYGFTRDREDLRTASVLAMILNTHNAAHASKKQPYKPVSPIGFLPDYLGERDAEKEVVEKSIEEQAREFQAFKERYLTASARATGS